MQRNTYILPTDNVELTYWDLGIMNGSDTRCISSPYDKIVKYNVLFDAFRLYGILPRSKSVQYQNEYMYTTKSICISDFSAEIVWYICTLSQLDPVPRLP